MIDADDHIRKVVELLEKTPSTKKSVPKGKWNPWETHFDRVHLILKVFELTKDKSYLAEHLQPFIDLSVKMGQFRQWTFGPQKEYGVFRDADTIGYFLLFFGMAEVNGLDIPDEFSIKQNIKQFELLVETSGGITTYFDKASGNNIDPVVNSTIYWAYHLSHSHNDVSEGIKKYLNTTMASLRPYSAFSRYYPSVIYLAERLSKIGRYDTSFLSSEAAASIDHIVSSAKPKNVWQAAQLSKTAIQRGKKDMASQINAELAKKQKKDGFFPVSTFYRQNTPRYNFGSEMGVTLTVAEAIKMEQKLTQVTY